MNRNKKRKWIQMAGSLVLAAAMVVAAVPQSGTPILASASQAALSYNAAHDRNVGVNGPAGSRSVSLGRGSQGYINYMTGNLALEFEIAPGVTLTYNSQTDVDYKMGLGVTCNLQQHVEMLNDMTYVHTEGDGSRHYYQRQGDGPEYIDERGYVLTNYGGYPRIYHIDASGTLQYVFDQQGRLIERNFRKHETGTPDSTMIEYDQNGVIASVENNFTGKLLFSYARPIGGKLRLGSVYRIVGDDYDTMQLLCRIYINDLGYLETIQHEDGNKISLTYPSWDSMLVGGVSNRMYESDVTFAYRSIGGYDRIDTFGSINPNRPDQLVDGAQFVYSSDETMVTNSLDGTSYTVRYDEEGNAV